MDSEFKKSYIRHYKKQIEEHKRAIAWHEQCIKECELHLNNPKLKYKGEKDGIVEK